MKTIHGVISVIPRAAGLTPVRVPVVSSILHQILVKSTSRSDIKRKRGYNLLNGKSTKSLFAIFQKKVRYIESITKSYQFRFINRWQNLIFKLICNKAHCHAKQLALTKVLQKKHLELLQPWIINLLSMLQHSFLTSFKASYPAILVSTLSELCFKTRQNIHSNVLLKVLIYEYC